MQFKNSAGDWLIATRDYYERCKVKQSLTIAIVREIVLKHSQFFIVVIRLRLCSDSVRKFLFVLFEQEFKLFKANCVLMW